MTLDLDTLKQSVDLLSLVERDTQLKRVAGTLGGEYHGACPFCDGRDRFRVQPNGGHDARGWWACRKCDPKGGDVIAYVMRREASGFRRACELLRGGTLPIPQQRRTALPPTRPTGPELNQTAAGQVVSECEAELWKDRCVPVRDYLYERGLTDDTLRLWRVGYCATGRRDEYGREIGGMYVPRGIVLPHVIGGAVWALKIRLMPGVPFKCSKCKAVLTDPGECPHCGETNKMRGVKGNRAALFGAETLRGKWAAVLCEGEFDAMLLYQHAGDLAGVATFGSARPNLDTATWAAYLLPIAILFIAYDTDETGEAGADAIMGLSRRARRLTAPVGAKDITDAWKAGGDLRRWVADALAKHREQGIAAQPEVVGNRRR